MYSIVQADAEGLEMPIVNLFETMRPFFSKNNCVTN